VSDFTGSVCNGHISLPGSDHPVYPRGHTSWGWSRNLLLSGSGVGETSDIQGLLYLIFLVVNRYHFLREIDFLKIDLKICFNIVDKGH
jgi:hypothetical protein